MDPSLNELSTLLTETVDGILGRMPRRGEGVEKADGSVVTEADTRLQRALESVLQRHWPDWGFLGEELTSGARAHTLAASDEPFWCLDPLDGTSNFAAGLPFYSVSLALMRSGRSVMGLVYDPVRGECFTAVRGGGAWLEGERLSLRAPQGRPLRKCLAVVDFKRLPRALAQRVAVDPPFRSQRNLGSCALEWCWLAAGRFDLYLHGGMKLWDLAAGSLILAEAGGVSCTLDGAGVDYTRTTAQSVVAAGSPELLHDWRAWLGVPGE